jgi:serine phosphatase RsbU (regulator of sigma subunit)/HAMP domain-containing protein
MRQWAYIQTRSDAKDKTEAIALCEKIIPENLNTVDSLSINWSAPDKALKDSVLHAAGIILAIYSNVREALPEFESYEDPLQRMQVEFQFEEGENLSKYTEKLQQHLSKLILSQQGLVNSESADMLSSFDQLRLYLGNISIFVIIVGILIAVATSRAIIRPVNRLKHVLFYMGRGIYPKKAMEVSEDEIGDMAFALNRLVDGLERTREFAKQVGKGNFGVTYTPLSEEDELGHTLLKMKEDLAITERELEKKVDERTDEVVRQKEEIEIQRNKVTELYKDLTDSINYAKRLQNTILPTIEQVREIFPDSFVFYRPKDIVSGDFYWFRKIGSKKMFAAIDCTGHGVPGAFMSLVGYNSLNQVTKVFTRPASILNNLNKLASESMRKEEEGHTEIRDGMDLSFCSIDSESLELEFAGAYNPVYLIRNGELTQIDADKFAIGSFSFGEKEYQNKRYQLEPGDCIYVFSDGYADQFGGPQGRKFMKTRFKEMLKTHSALSMEDQGKKLQETFEDWQGTLAQIDDVLVIGVRV